MANTRTVHIAIAEDKPALASLMRETVELGEDFHVSLLAPNGQSLLEQIKAMTRRPDVVLMDIQMPVMNGIVATSELKAVFPEIKIVMATVFDDKQHIFDAILVGADGYLLKDAEPQLVHQSIREVLAGGAPMSPLIARKALELLRKAPADTPKAPEIDLTGVLSKREMEILEHLARGLSYKQIAETLFIAQGTVRKHVENIYSKLQVHNKISAIELARRSGLI